MKKTHSVLIVTLLFTLTCSEENLSLVDMIELPSAYDASLPHLTTAQNGEVYISWIEQEADKQTTMKFSKLNESVWSSPSQIASGNNWFINWADFPSLIVNGDHMAAHWLQKSKSGTYDYDVRMKLSATTGSDWSESSIVHNDGISAEHGFASMLPMDNEQTFITWLDGRNTKKENGAMTLRAAIFDQDGNAINRWELDNRICDCCQTGATMTSNGPIVIYRDRSENEIRDMSIVRWVDGKWTQPAPIAIELWEIAGCPVNGPQITATNNRVSAAWFTAAGGTAKVKIAFSEDAGATFSNPILVSEGNTLGRVGIASLSNGDIVVSYMESKDNKAQIMLAQYSKSGDLIKRVQVAETSSERNSGFPVLTTSGDQIIMAWTEAREKSIVKTASINL